MNVTTNLEPSNASPFLVASTEMQAFLRHFGFREPPFGVTPDPDLVFWSEMHKAALHGLITSIESNLGFSVLVGEPGTGKTTLLLKLLAQYRDRARTAFIFQTQCSPHDLLRYIASDLDLRDALHDEVTLHHKLRDLLAAEARAGRKVLIVIDEGQNLQARSLEAIRLLSNFETGCSKLVHVVLAGQPRLAKTLGSPKLSQLAQRISTICRLQALTEDQVKDYVCCRVANVTPRRAEALFSPESFVEIASCSNGVPRLINAVCYRSLLVAWNRKERSVTGELVRQAALELELSAENASESTAASPRPLGRQERTGDLSHETVRQRPEQKVTHKTVSPLRVQKVSPDLSVASPSASYPNARNAGIAGIKEPQIASGSRQNYVRRSGTVAAILILAAVSGWISWNEFRAKPITIEASATYLKPELRKPEPLPSEIQAPETGTQGAQSFVTQPANVTKPITNIKQENGSGIQAPDFVDTSRSAMLPPKIHPQSFAAVEPVSPIGVMSFFAGDDNLNLRLPGSGASLPRLEAPVPNNKPAPVASNSNPPDTYSLHPFKVIQPEYPAKAVRAHIEGEVHLELTINQDGNVERVRALSGNPVLVQAAEEAVRHWQYSPGADKDFFGVTTTRVRFNFKMDREASTR